MKISVARSLGFVVCIAAVALILGLGQILANRMSGPPTRPPGPTPHLNPSGAHRVFQEFDAERLANQLEGLESEKELDDRIARMNARIEELKRQGYDVRP